LQGPWRGGQGADEGRYWNPSPPPPCQLGAAEECGTAKGVNCKQKKPQVNGSKNQDGQGIRGQA